VYSISGLEYKVMGCKCDGTWHDLNVRVVHSCESFMLDHFQTSSTRLLQLGVHMHTHQQWPVLTTTQLGRKQIAVSWR